MNSKLKTSVLFLAIAAVAVLTSCDKDEDVIVANPTITNLELGIDNSLIGYIGDDLHVEADILAESFINTVTVEIHAEDGSGEEIEAEFDYSDQTLKNTSFHEHIDIPEGTTAGDYHFHLTVTDKEGNSTTIEEELQLEVLADEEAPVLTISSAPTDGQSFASGESITISGSATDNTALAGMVIALVYADDAIADADVTGENSSVIVMLHTHTFDSEASHDFSTSIAVGAEYDNNMTPALIQYNNAWRTGNYYILAKCKDANGNWVYSSQYPVNISL